MPTVSDYTALLSGSSWNGIDVVGAPVIVTFSFPTSLPAYDASTAPDPIGGFTAATDASFRAFTAAEQTQALDALNAWAAVSGVIFLQAAPGHGDVNFANVDFRTTNPDPINGDYRTSGGIAFYPFGFHNFYSDPYFQDDRSTAGDIFMNTAYQNADGTVSAGTLLHEIGHAIGLKHPTQTVVDAAGVTHDQVLAADDPLQTIMASSGDGGAAATLKPLDAQAAAFLYGTAGAGGVYTTSMSGVNAVSAWSWNAITQTLTQTAISNTVHGTSLDDVIIGNDSGDKLFGLGGNDSLIGGAGNDSLYGGSGRDTLAGGAGDDTYYVISPDDVIVEQTNGGFDSVIATVSYTAPANVELLQISGQGLTATANDTGDTLFGDGLYASRLIGGKDNDTIVGGSGNDSIGGGGGVDLMYGGGGANTFVFTKPTDAALGGNLTTIGDFKPGTDTIDLSAITAAGGGALSFSAANAFSGQPGQVIAVADPNNASNTILEGDLNGDLVADFAIELAGVTSVTANDVVTAACYLAGTRIATERGDVAIDALALGDRVVTASGELRPILWLGHRRINAAKHPDREAAWPYLVAAGAFAEGVPARDLWLSPRHSVVVGNALVPICELANGLTIRQVPLSVVEYWHLELATHDIVLAEGLAAETYLDNGNRTAFVNGGDFIEAHPDFAPKHWTDTCLPLVLDGPIVRDAKAALLARAGSLGEAITAEDDLHAMVGARRIDPLPLGEGRRAFVLPGGASPVVLRSRVFVPAEIDPDSPDRRHLGICIARLQLDGTDLPLDDEALFAEGWHPMESHRQGRQRWSMGDAPLPAGTRLVVVDVVGRGYYWQPRQDHVVSMFM